MKGSMFCKILGLTAFAWGMACVTACGDDESNFIAYGEDWESSNSQKAKSSSSSKESASNVELSFGRMTDERDDQVYKTVKIGNREWMAENLNLRYLQPTDSLDSSSFCYDNSAENCEKYGRLYIWSAAMDSAGVYTSESIGNGVGTLCFSVYPIQGICPEGWHLPSEYEWNELKSKVNVGVALRSTYDWEYSNGTDDFSFTALPAGLAVNGTYNFLHTRALFWSSTEAYGIGKKENKASYNAFFLSLEYKSERESIVLYSTGKHQAFSVRCLKDY